MTELCPPVIRSFFFDRFLPPRAVLEALTEEGRYRIVLLLVQLYKK